MNTVPKIQTKRYLFGAVKKTTIDYTEYRKCINGREFPHGQRLVINVTASPFMKKHRYKALIENPAGCTIFTYNGKHDNYAEMQFKGSGGKVMQEATHFLEGLGEAFPSEKKLALKECFNVGMGIALNASGRKRQQ